MIIKFPKAFRPCRISAYGGQRSHITEVNLNHDSVKSGNWQGCRLTVDQYYCPTSEKKMPEPYLTLSMFENQSREGEFSPGFKRKGELKVPFDWVLSECLGLVAAGKVKLTDSQILALGEALNSAEGHTK